MYPVEELPPWLAWPVIITTTAYLLLEHRAARGRLLIAAVLAAALWVTAWLGFRLPKGATA